MLKMIFGSKRRRGGKYIAYNFVAWCKEKWGETMGIYRVHFGGSYGQKLPFHLIFHLTLLFHLTST